MSAGEPPDAPPPETPALERRDQRDGRRRAGTLLDRALPDGYREEWTRRFAEAPQDHDEAGRGAGGAALLFRIGEEWLALPTAILEEVAEPRRPHALPHRRDNLVRGVVNVRGELLVCIDLAALLSLSDTPVADGDHKSFPRMIVIGREGRRAAFQVDEVHGVLRYTGRDLVDTPATIGKSSSTLAAAMIAWNGHTVGQLAAEPLLDAVDRSIG